MSKELFPKEIIEYTAESNFSKHGVRTKLIYFTVVAAVVAILIVLPLINVTVSVRSSGVIRPKTERSKLVSLVSGKIDELYIKDNQRVTRGQIVAKISSPVLKRKYHYTMQQQQKIKGYLSDLSVLLKLDAKQVSETFTSEAQPISEGTPSPLTTYKNQLQTTLQIIQGIQSESGNNISGQQPPKDLDAARATLLSELNKKNSLILGGNVDSAGEAQKKISTFKAGISSYISDVLKYTNDAERRKKLNKLGIVSDDTLQSSLHDLNRVWQSLISALTDQLLPALSVEKPQQPAASQKTYLQKVLDDQLVTPNYKNSLLAFIKKSQGSIQDIENARQKFERQKELYHREIISKANFQKFKDELQSARLKYQLLFEKQLNSWRQEQIKYQNKLDDLDLDEHTNLEKRDKYTIRAPITGTVQGMKGLYEGGLVSPNQTLAVISPDTGLIAEVYVPPSKIGLIRDSMDVVFQVTAYDYNQWGLLKGRVKDISNDVISVNEQPVFKVTCKLDRTWLTLKNGYRGNIKKGMGIQARFKISRRSLFQLLYDEVDDWLNPKWESKTMKPQQAGI